MTPNAQSLEGLIEWVKAATGPMTGIEVEACIRLSPWYSTLPSHDPIWNDFVRALQGSIDAALALVERCLPGWAYTLNRGHCELRHPKTRAKDVQAFGKTAPLAILLALLTAMQDQNNER